MRISKRLVVSIMTMLCLLLTACGTPAAANKVVTATDGYAEGGIGTTFRNAFFDYSVDSVAYPSEYEGYVASEDMQLVDVVITIKNTFGDALPMFNSDFQIQWHDLGDGDEDYGFGVEMDSSSTIMPSEYTLANGDTCTYHVVFEVPAEAKEFSVWFQEYFDDGSQGDMFCTLFNK